jgi:hypothetical protein
VGAGGGAGGVGAGQLAALPQVGFLLLSSNVHVSVPFTLLWAPAVS